MKKNFFLSTFIFLILMTSCSHTKIDNKIGTLAAGHGLIKSPKVNFPVYLTEKLESKNALEKKYSQGLFLIHTGHILKSKLSKAENEQTLTSLSHSGFDLVNLTLEDFEVAALQGIQFSNYNLTFLNSSVIDLNSDTLASENNIVSYYVRDGIAFVGLSDHNASEGISREKYIVDDYVLSVLKVKKIASKKVSPALLRSFVIIHTLDTEMNEVMERLPPYFINSQAN